MTVFAVNPETLKTTLTAVLGDKAKRIDVALGEVCVVVDASNYLDVATQLRDAPGCQFEQLIDLCGIDYSEYKEGAYEGPRYCVVESANSFKSLCQRR
jgi:NADH-quinone oxidoreductase subunit C